EQSGSAPRNTLPMSARSAAGIQPPSRGREALKAWRRCNHGSRSGSTGVHADRVGLQLLGLGAPGRRLEMRPAHGVACGGITSLRRGPFSVPRKYRFEWPRPHCPGPGWLCRSQNDANRVASSRRASQRPIGGDTAMAYIDRDGVKLYYEVAGSGPVVLLSHGYSASTRMWQGQIAPLKDAYTVVTWDMRGHAQSDSPDDPSRYSEEATVDDMAAILAEVGAERAVIGGLSLGGYMSLAFYARRPELV